MADANGLTPKVYRKLLTSIYLQNQRDAKTLKDRLVRGGNPILQKENRYFSPTPKRNVLTEEYFKKLKEKPEKRHIKRIPKESNLGKDLISVKENKKIGGKKTDPIIRKNWASMSAQRIEKKKNPDAIKSYYKHFYLDNFNSIKQNQNDINNKKRMRYRNKPKDIDYISGTLEPEKVNFDNIFGFKRPQEDTKEDIFPTGNSKPLIRVKRNVKIKKNKNLTLYTGENVRNIMNPSKKGIEKKLPTKPCNNDYNKVKNEAKKNANVRYYFESNASHWKIH